MAHEEQGFTVNYTVNNITSIKPTASGIANGNKYDASMKVRTLKLDLKNDEKLGLIEKETNIEFTIYCDDKNLRDFNVWLRKQQKENKPLIISGELPYFGDGKSIGTVKAYLTGEEIMAQK